MGIVNVSPSFYPLGGTVFVRIDDGGEIFLMFHTRNRPNMQLAECDFAPFANFRDPKIEEEKILNWKKEIEEEMKLRKLEKKKCMSFLCTRKRSQKIKRVQIGSLNEKMKLWKARFHTERARCFLILNDKPSSFFRKNAWC